MQAIDPTNAHLTYNGATMLCGITTTEMRTAHDAPRCPVCVVTAEHHRRARYVNITAHEGGVFHPDCKACANNRCGTTGMYITDGRERCACGCVANPAGFCCEYGTPITVAIA